MQSDGRDTWQRHNQLSQRLKHIDEPATNLIASLLTVDAMISHNLSKRRLEIFEPTDGDGPGRHVFKKARVQPGSQVHDSTHAVIAPTLQYRENQIHHNNIEIRQPMPAFLSSSDFKSLQGELFDSIEDHQVGESDKEIILPEAVKSIWAPRCYHKFYTQQVWYNASWDKSNVIDNYLRIMSILVHINFSRDDWENFGHIFIEKERKDGLLPFALDELQRDDFLGRVVGKNFYERQWAFCPVPIYEREEPYILKGRERLPWINEPEGIGEGVSGIVRKQTLAASYLIYNNKGRNFEDKAVAIKSVSDSKVRKQEFKNLRKLRGCLSGHKRIMVNIATIVEEHVKLNKTYHILYEVAAFDLNVLLTTPISQLRKKRKESAPPSRNNSINMQPADLVLESRNLADALDFLHSRLYNTKKISLAHNDIKPENILVVYPDSTDPQHKYPVGKWKLADFGLSRVKDKIKGEAKLLGPEDALPSPVKTEVTHRLEPSTSVSKTFPKREAGRYTAPEQDQDEPQKADGRKADVWSFGCVLSEVVAYAVQLDCTLVEEFRDHLSKPNYSDQRFYDVGTKDIKPCFYSYLDELPRKEVKSVGTAWYGPDWVVQCTDLVKKIVLKDPSKRLGADKIRDELRDIYRYMRPERRSWVDSHLNVDTAVDADSSSSSSSVADSPREMEPSATGSFGSIESGAPTPIIKITEAPVNGERLWRRQSSPI